MYANHVVDGIVDSLDHLLLPVARRPLLPLPPPCTLLPLPSPCTLLPLPPATVEHIVEVYGAVELGGPDPLEEHGGAGLAHEGHDVGAAGRPYVGPDGGRRVVRFPLVLGGVGAHPDLVLAVGLWGKAKGNLKNPPKDVPLVKQIYFNP